LKLSSSVIVKRNAYYAIFHRDHLEFTVLSTFCSAQEVTEFTSSFEFLDLLVNTQLDIPSEELIAACLREISQNVEDKETILIQAGRYLAGILSNDTRRLKSILDRIRL